MKFYSLSGRRGKWMLCITREYDRKMKEMYLSHIEVFRTTTTFKGILFILVN